MWKPPTSSCSASTRSKGGLFNSAVIAIMKTTKGTTPVESRCQFVIDDCYATMPDVDRVPAVIRTAARLSPSAAS